jgi:hypothetical protein
MSLPILHELQDDLKRLMIAGSDLATGDISIKKKIPVLLKMGEKAPVFTRIAQFTKNLVSGKEPTSEHLLELSTLLSSIMYTMGKTGRDGDLVVGETICEFPTDISYLTLKPIIEALTTKGSGRGEIIEQAYHSGKIYDLRLIYPLIAALDDSYPELADFVAEHILPKYGQELLPILQPSFSVKGKKGDGRRLKVMAEILGGEGLPFYYDCIENGSTQVQIAGLEILSQYEQAEEVLLSYTKAKKADVRLVAYKSLAKRESDTAINCLVHALEGKDRNLLIEAAVAGSTDKLRESMLGFAKKLIGEYMESEKSKQGDLLSSLSSIIQCFWHSKSPKVIGFLRDVIEDSKVHSPLARHAALVLLENQAETVEYIESLFMLPGRQELADLSFIASLRSRPKEEVFDRYSIYVKKTRKDIAGTQILETMDGIVFFREDLRQYDDKYYYYEYKHYTDDFFNGPSLIDIEWDERWVELLIDIDEEKLVYRLAKKVTGQKHLDYLMKKLHENPYFSSKRGMGVLTSMIQTNYEDAFTVLVDTLKKTDVNMKSVKYHTHTIIQSLDLFLYISKEYANELAEIADKQIEHEKLKERLLEIVFELRKQEGI